MSVILGLSHAHSKFNCVTPIDNQLSAPDTILVVRDLARLECRVTPIRDQDQALSEAFDAYFARVVDEIIPPSREVVDRATSIRAQYKFKAADALQLAAAVKIDVNRF